MSGCLSKPEWPSGIDDGGVNAAAFALRRQVAIGDVDGDGLDDLVTWGNDGEHAGHAPRIRIHFGGAQGLAAEPNATVDPRFELDLPWYEVLDVAIAPLRHELVFLTAENLLPRPAQPRRLHSGVISVGANRVVSPPIGCSQDDLTIDNYADEPAPVFVVERRTVADGSPQIVFGAVAMIQYAAIATTTTSSPSIGDFFFFTQPDEIEQEMFADVGAMGGDDLILVTEKSAYRGTYDFGAGMILDGSLIGTACARTARGRRIQSTFHAVATCQGTPTVTLIASSGAGAPSTSSFTIRGATSPTDLAIADLAGDPARPELVTIEDATLIVYGDVVVAAPATAAWTLSTTVDGYDLIAAGNFRSDMTGELYVLSSTDRERTPLCLHIDLTSSSIDPCG